MSVESPQFPPPETGHFQKPTRVRFGVTAVLIAMACLLYLDRFAVSIAAKYIREDLRMTQTQMSWFLSAFFWSYALSQVPSGWLSDRFGRRVMLTAYILAWSVFTGWLGFVTAVWSVLHLRLYCGIAQAGAFPVCGGMIRAWFPISQRGTASSIIGLGGRAGGVLAPILTAWLITATATSGAVSEMTPDDILQQNAFVSDFLTELSNKSSQDRLINQLHDGLPDSLKSELALKDKPAAKPGSTEAGLPAAPTSTFFKSLISSLRDWIPTSSQPSKATTESAEEERLSALAKLILENWNARLDDPTLVTNANTAGLELTAKAKTLLEQRGTEGRRPLSSTEIRLLNRLGIEAAFPKQIKKYYGKSWRPVLIAYGAVGIVVALVFAWVARNSPDQHPWCNAAELALINDDATLAAKATQPADAPFPWAVLLTSVSLWGNSLMQLFTNIGWLFVVTWLPRYLDEVHKVPLGEQALMTAIPTAAGIVSMFFGGWWTDFAVKKAGLKWGRRLPVFSTRLMAAAGYGLCVWLGMTCVPDPTTRWLPWAIVIGLSIMVMGVDLGVPAVWAYAQDVGGKYTGAILGWANMWGNIGAAIAPLIYNYFLGETPKIGDWNTMFAVCGIAFVLSALCGLVLDASKPISVKT